jgi:catechol 2,3-dioxygenase-like lactoylglutathione lyase family enzyme
MFSHVTIGSNAIARAIGFYDAVLPVLGLRRHEGDAAAGQAGYALAPEATPQFWVMRPFDGQAASAGNGVTIAFLAGDRAVVDAFHAAVLVNGGRDEGAPGLRPNYHADCYAAYGRDLDGNKLCCMCHATG